jgi:2-C-methyl-D-erythritol 4-phosphate cytidylyltransferase
MRALPSGARLVLVQDVVRPLAAPGVVPKLLDAIDAGADAAVPVWPLSDTLKELHGDGRLTHVGREGLVVAQSPIAVRTSTLSLMFDEVGELPVEETVGIERIGGRVAGVPGDPWSHHVVEPRDLVRMERLLDLAESGEGDESSRA